MTKKMNRREALKLLSGSAALVASAPLLNIAEGSERALGHSPARRNRRLRQTTEISFWVPPMWRYGADNETVVGSGSDEWIKDAIERFEAEYPSIKVDLELIPWDQWDQKTATGFASGDLPNVIYNMLKADRIEAGVFEPLEGYVTDDMRDNWVAGAFDSLSLDGHLYGVPAFLNPDMSAFSKSALEKHGGIELLDEIGADRSNVTFDLMRKYGEIFSDAPSRYFLGVPTDHFSVVYWGFGQWLNGWGIPMWNEDQTRWIAHEADKSVEAMQWYVDAQADGMLIPNLPKWSDVDTFYWNLDCAMRFQWTGIQTELEVAQEAGQAGEDFEIVLAAFPHLPEVGPFRPNVAPNSFNVTKTGNDDKREAAFTFANWLATDDSNAVTWLVNGIFPATKSGAEAVSSHPKMQDPNLQWVLNEYLPNYSLGYVGWNYDPTRNARTAEIFNRLNPGDLYIQQFQSMLLGQKSPEQMLEELADRINGALGVD